MTNAVSWSELRKVLNPLRPAPAALYVPPPRSVAEDIAEDITASPETHPKVLLVGPSGGGKSSELWAIRRAIGDRRICIDIDLDRSGIGAVGLGAKDLMYIAGLGMLRHLPEGEKRELHGRLARAYGGPESDPAALGEVEDGLRALAGFLDAAGGVVGVAELAAGSPALVGGGSKALAGVVRLFTDRPALVSESSPWGGELQTAVHEIHEALVTAHDHRAVCLLIDGMEKMNGASAAKFREVFETTRLLLNLPCAAVFAAPACTLTESNAAAAHGWSPRPIYAFTGNPKALVDLLERRIRHVGLEPAAIVPAQGLARLAKLSGGMPRYAMAMLDRATELARRKGLSRIPDSLLDQAIDELAEELCRGLREPDWQVLRRVRETGELPGGEDAARLFSDGRVLVIGPDGPGRPSRRPRFRVHPLIERELGITASDE